MKKWILLAIVCIVVLLSININNSKTSKKEIKHIDYQSKFLFDKKYMSYKMDYNIHFISNGSLKTPKDINMSAVLNIEVNKNQTILLKCQFDNLKINSNDPFISKLEQIYSLPFGIEIAKNGKFLDYILNFKGDTLSFLKLIFSFETIIENKPIYMVNEKLENSNYVSIYTWKDNILYKTRTNKSTETNIELSNIKITLDKTWIKNLILKETVQYYLNKVKIFKANINLKLYRIKSNNIPIDINYTKKTEIDFSKLRQKAIEEQIKNSNIDLNNLISQIKTKLDLKKMNLLVQYLKLYPDKISQLYDLVIHNKYKIADRFIFVLQKLQLPQSQDILFDIAMNENISKEKRQSAIISLGFQKNIQEYIVDELKNTPDDDEHTIFLALSNISRNNKNTAIADNINDRIDKTFKKDPTTAMLAMENVGVDKFKNKFVAVLKDSNYSTYQKELSIQALSKSDTNETKKIFVDELVSNSSNNDVKASLLIALSKFPTDDQVLNYIYKNIDNTPQGNLLDAMSLYLLVTAKDTPQNIEYLKKTLPYVNESLQKQIIKLIRSQK